MRYLWHRLLVRLGLREPFVLTPSMIVNIALAHIDQTVAHNAVLRHLREKERA